MYVVIDIETEKLDKPSKIHVIGCIEVETEKVHTFLNVHENPDEFNEFAKGVTCWITMNGLGFDIKVINRLAHTGIDLKRVIDLQVVSRLLNYKIPGGHSLKAWGERTGQLKTEFNEFDTLSQKMIDYCIDDCKTTLATFFRLKKYIFSPMWRESLRLEHDTAIICDDLHETGFKFDIEGAKRLYKELDTLVEELYSELNEAFPPKTKLIKEITPKATKFGTISRSDFRWLEDGDLSVFTPGAPFSRFEYIPFNPGSPKQVVERLNEAGWTPYEKTKGYLECERDLRVCKDFKEREKLLEKIEHYKVYGWKVCEENLETLPETAPAGAHKLARWLLLSSRRGNLETWMKAYDETDGRIHGTFFHIGAWTHRKSHANPNSANIASDEKDGKVAEYGKELRQLWTVEEGNILVGVDADSIQLRVLAHYMNDKAFTKALISGQKEDGTDAHTMNQKALGHVCKSRSVAKTFIYAWLLGAGIPKVANILSCSHTEAKQAVDSFLSAYPGLEKLKKVTIPNDASNGYFIGFDGRAIMCSSEHLMLAGYLQAGESIVMKWACRHWRNELTKRGIWFKQVNDVHDEWQTETKPEFADEVIEVQIESIRLAGKHFNLNCPLDGSGAKGYNWWETH